MKILLTGGGTGGHIYPAIAIGDKIRKKYPNSDILYVGTKKGLESELVPKAGFTFKTITVSGFRRKLSIDNLKTLRDLVLGLNQARRIIDEFKPDIVVGTGGYVCGPIVLIAALKNIKTVIHEQNVIPGVTNKILGKLTDKIFISFEESINFFNNNKVILAGNPVREDFNSINTVNCKRKLKLDNSRLTILSFGGSRGAKKINDTMVEVIKMLNDIKDVSLIHITGKYYYNDIINTLKGTIDLNENIKIYPYIHNMPEVMGAADLIISRAGAITLAEITTLGKASILVPSPNVVNNHQEHNARVLEKNGAAFVFLEQDFVTKDLVELILKLKNDKIKLKNMSDASKRLGGKDSAEIILNSIENFIHD